MTTKREYLQLLDEMEKPIRDQFLQYVATAVGAASIAEVETLLRRGDIDGILSALGVNEAALADTTEAIRDAYIAGGKFEAPAARITFNIRNPGAENWIRQHSSDLVTRITNSQRQAIRETLESGMRLGRNPRQTALDIVGRVSQTGRRKGGIVGLTDPQAKYVANAREQLLSGDPSQMRQYFSRTRRDRRYDGIVNRAIEAGKPVKTADVDRIVGRYSDRLLNLRGETIGRTESIAALNAGRDQAAQQAISEGVISADLMLGTWLHSFSRNPRDTHIQMNGQKRKQGEPFQSPSGAMMMYPGDTSLGAGAEDVANCRCYRRMEYDFIEEAAREVA